MALVYGSCSTPLVHGAAVGARLDHHLGEIAAQDVVSGVTAVVAVGHGDVIGPRQGRTGLGCSRSGAPFP